MTSVEVVYTTYISRLGTLDGIFTSRSAKKLE
jgi:hypothetical protein